MSLCLVVQAFEKAPVLKAMAPTQSEPPFLVAQVIILVLFVVLAGSVGEKIQQPGPYGLSGRPSCWPSPDEVASEIS